VEESQYIEHNLYDEARTDAVARYTPLQRSVNKETGKHRLLSENDEQNISSSLKTPSSTMRTLCGTYSRVIAVPRTNV
jgi:hypothetical protein